MVLSRTVSLMGLSFILASCGGGSSGGSTPAGPNPPAPGPGGGNPTAATVSVRNNSFSPNRVTVTPGATVTWQWDSCTDDGYGGQACTAHSVTFDDGGTSASLRSEGSFSRTFPAAGTFTYRCSAHAAMSGSVVAQ
jgi:plastocyanin